MIDEKLKKEILEKKSFEWSQGRYYYDRRVSTLYGHAKKHLKKEYKRFQKLINYNLDSIDDEAVDSYKKISIDNINNNKYVQNRVYFNKNNKSLNIVGDNNLETCLKPCISKNNELVIVSCFFRDYIYNFYDSIGSYSKRDLNYVVKFFTTNDIGNKVSASSDIDFDSIKNNLVLSLKERKSESIVKMIENYFNNITNFEIPGLLDEVNRILDNIKYEISNLIDFGKDYSFNFKDIPIQEYDKTKIDDDMKNMLDEIDNITYDEIDKLMESYDKKNEFVSMLDLSDIYDLINDLCIVYIYSKVFSDYDMLFDYCKYMHYIDQLSSGENMLNESITLVESIIGFNGQVNNNLYSKNEIILNYKSNADINNEKYDMKTIKSKMKKMELEYGDSTEIICKYCNNCGKKLYFTRNSFSENVMYNGNIVFEDRCPECGSDNVEYVISNAETRFLRL